MAWDDSDDDDVPAPKAVAKPVKVAPAKVADDWEDEEVVVEKAKDDWDDEESEEEPAWKKAERAAAAKPAAKPKPKPKPKAEVYVPLDDPVAEKLRQQKLVEESDARLAGDLFDGCERPEAPEQQPAAPAASSAAAASTAAPKVVTKDTFAELKLKSQKDVENFAQQVVKKIEQATAKGAAFRFLNDVTKALDDALEIADIESMVKNLNAMKVRKKKEATAKKQLECKKSNQINKHNVGKMDLNAELADVFGGHEDDDEDDEYYDEAEDFM